ncbi:MAG TPA: hypothetical protein VLK33_02885 [Terriglobales bacterium]|nr:hypothetical protein [Terriglobales bacterium]
MQKKVKVSLWLLAIVLIGVGTGFYILHRMRNPLTIMGAVTIKDADFRKELPIADVEVSVAGGAAEAPVKSDASGYFVLHLRRWLRRGRPITLQFRHPNYQPLDIPETAQNKLYVAHMVPRVKKPDSNTPTVAIGNVRVRYSIKAPRTMNVGSAVKAFEVKNIGNVPCDHHAPCSPDGKWKATIGSVMLDAGTGNEFLNARVSCIAGPCPFTRIESDDISNPAQKITAVARNWSDSATFLVEAEVIHVMQSAIDHQSYPVIFGSALNFTLPKNAEGVSFEADMGGDTIIFPLGPSLLLSWADCNTRASGDGTIYRCELKPGYRF